MPDINVIHTPPELGNLLVDNATYTSNETYHDLFKDLRANAPVTWAEPDGYRPFWTLSKHADIREIEFAADKFLNEPRSFLLTAADEEQVAAAKAAGLTAMDSSVVQVDGHKHRSLRRITQAWFAPANIAKLQLQTKEIASQAIDEMRSYGGKCDFVRHVAQWYPLRVIMLILGLPREDEAHLLNLTQALFAPGDPDTDVMAGASGMMEASRGIKEYFDIVTIDRRRNPRDDVASVIANAIIDGAPISEIDAAAYYMTIVTAGHDTTSSTTSGGVLALLQHPDEFAKLRTGTVPLNTAIDEFLRWTTPIKHFFRTATDDYELRGQTIRAGDSLMLCYPSANRDEDVFVDPFSFRVDRLPNAQLAFGYGPHVCLGQHLAKFEIRIFFEEFLKRVQSISLDGDAALTETNFVQGLKTLPVRYSLS